MNTEGESNATRTQQSASSAHADCATVDKSCSLDGMGDIGEYRLPLRNSDQEIEIRAAYQSLSTLKLFLNENGELLTALYQLAKYQRGERIDKCDHHLEISEEMIGRLKMANLITMKSGRVLDCLVPIILASYRRTPAGEVELVDPLRIETKETRRIVEEFLNYELKRENAILSQILANDQPRGKI